MKTREFLESLPDLLRQQLPPELGGFHLARSAGTLMKLYYDHPTVHYEVWVQRRKGQVELGLHLEGDQDANARYLSYLSGRADDIREALGEDVEIGAWDKGWARVHESLPLEPLTDDFMVEVSFRLSAMIRVLEPLVKEATAAGLR